MPILLMALLALVVFGLIGILLTAAVIMEQSKLKRKIKRNPANPVISGSAPTLHPKV